LQFVLVKKKDVDLALFHNFIVKITVFFLKSTPIIIVEMSDFYLYREIARQRIPILNLNCHLKIVKVFSKLLSNRHQRDRSNLTNLFKNIFIAEPRSPT